VKKIILLLHIGLYAIQPCSAQNTKDKSVLSAEQTKQIMNSIKIDTAKILRENALRSCQCIDSVLKSRKVGEENTNALEDVGTCIDKQTDLYQMTMKLFRSLTSDNKNIVINTNKNSQDYKKYYSDIENWLMDSCSALKMLVGSNDSVESELSVSEDPEAIKQYNAGIKYFVKEEYSSALPYFKKAVEADSKFVFAWDDLAICYRRTGLLDKALETYNKSLQIFPKGKTPLQNIPVIYELQKDYDKALVAYKNMLRYYPDDVETYYGIGRILISYTNDLEQGLDNMCKAFNLYTKMKSPYRVDAEKNISVVYAKMKEQGKEELFYKILKDNNISTK
jgi:tetratricopeptide (TPR) repeat protein